MVLSHQLVQQSDQSMHRGSRPDLQDVALTGRQHFEDLVLNLLQAAFVGSAGNDEVVLLLLQLWPLLGHHNPQQLLLQPLMRCHERQQAHLKEGEKGLCLSNPKGSLLSQQPGRLT